MGIYYELEGITNSEDLCWRDDNMNPLTTALILLTVTVGIERITKRNYWEFFSRVAMVDRVMGPILVGENRTHRPITLEDIRQHIGLKTNAALKSRLELRMTLWTCLEDQAARALAREVRPKTQSGKERFETLVVCAD